MTNQEMYASQIAVVKQECPEADDSEIGQEFERYEKEFLIPPEDALRSVIRKFQASTGKEVTSASNSPVREEKKVGRFAELGADDRNVTIEVTVVSYTPRTQMVRAKSARLPSVGLKTTHGRQVRKESGGITRTGGTRGRA